MKVVKFFLIFIILTSTLLFTTSPTVHAKESRNQGGIPILLYHHMLKKSENHFTNNSSIINVDAFEEQMKYLHDQGYYTATLSELASYLSGKTVLPQKTVVITFDDGHKTNYLYAYPILKRYGFKAANFLITNRISQAPASFDPKTYQFLSWPEINEMKDVFQFGSHTNALHNLYNGQSALVIESEDVILNDLKNSRNLINTDYFAYPFGAYTKRTIELLKQAGYKYAFTTVPTNANIGDNVYELGRKAVYPSTSLTNFKAMVTTGSSKAGWVKNGGKWYFYDGNGVKRTGWLKLADTWYYFNQSGVMQTGWIKSGGCWYYLDHSGAMKTGWIKTGSKWYYFNSNGVMQTGWLKNGETWYYFATDGSMKTGWIQVKSSWYYLYQNGEMALNTNIDGYQIGADGAWVR